MKPTDPDYNERMAAWEWNLAKQFLVALPFALAFAAFVGWLTEGEDTTDCAPRLAAIDEQGE